MDAGPLRLEEGCNLKRSASAAVSAFGERCMPLRGVSNSIRSPICAGRRREGRSHADLRCYLVAGDALLLI